MCFDYDFTWDFYSDKAVVARKDHRCSECNAVIPKGDAYHYHVGKGDGDLFVFHVCRRCDYDHNRVVEHELAVGCSIYEASCPLGELAQYLSESGMGQTAPEDVPASFRVGDEPRRPGAKPPPVGSLAS